MEILHGEGGEDSKHFAASLKDVYLRYASKNALHWVILDECDGHYIIKIVGRDAGKIFSGEAGKHCVQRIPGNERGGRKHTSFVSVAVLPLPPENTIQPIPKSELEITYQTGRQKAGGQNANKVASAVRARHLPTGLSVFINGRDQHFNKREAIRILTAKVNSARNYAKQKKYANTKSSQLDDRGRGGKIRTYNFMDGYVIDHRTNKRTNNIKAVMKGELELVR